MRADEVKIQGKALPVFIKLDKPNPEEPLANPFEEKER
jgi:hypothetical protein